MIVPVLRLKLSDFLGTDYETEVLDKLREINNLDFMPPFEIYLWYDRDNDKVELNRLKDFIVDWESRGDFKSKTIIVPEFFDRPVDFIWYDNLKLFTIVEIVCKFRRAFILSELNCIIDVV